MSYYIPENTKKSNIFMGAASGLAFGPIGGVVGGLAGGLLGGSSGADRRRAKERATKQSYEFAEGVYTDATKRRGDIQSKFDREMSSALARYSGSSGSGVDLSGSWENVKGHLIAQRNEALEALGGELSEFEASDSFKWIREDYEYMWEQEGMAARTTKAGTTPDTRQIRLQGRTGETLFSDKTVADMVMRKPGKYYDDYLKRIRPTFTEWRKQRFGTQADKDKFNAAMKQRIESGNRWLNQKIAEDLAFQRASRNYRGKGADNWLTPTKVTDSPMFLERGAR